MVFVGGKNKTSFHVICLSYFSLSLSKGGENYLLMEKQLQMGQQK